MSKSDNYITITVKRSEILEQLKNLLQTPHADHLSSTIVEYMESNGTNGMTVLYKAMNNIKFKPVFKLGDLVYVKHSVLPTWRMDMTKLSVFGFQGKVKGRIKDINPISESPYGILIDYINTAGESVTDTWYSTDQYLELREELPDEEEILKYFDKRRITS